MATPPIGGYSLQPRRWVGPIVRRLRQTLLILAVVVVVLAILFVIGYGVGIRHHHFSIDHGTIATFTTRA